jgi:hypothetical protein
MLAKEAPYTDEGSNPSAQTYAQQGFGCGP